MVMCMYFLALTPVVFSTCNTTTTCPNRVKQAIEARGGDFCRCGVDESVEATLSSPVGRAPAPLSFVWRDGPRPQTCRGRHVAVAVGEEEGAQGRSGPGSVRGARDNLRMEIRRPPRA